MSFTAVSYNVLADAYIHPEWYPATPPSVLDPTWRQPALVRHLTKLSADVLCLQEVEPERFAAFDAHLRPLGYAGHYARKRGGKPDGSATFVREGSFSIQGVQTLHYADGSGTSPSSGHLALVVNLEHSTHKLAVVNTHLKWDAPGTPLEAQRGYRQIRELLDARATLVPRCPAWIIVGDFNAAADSPVVRALRAAGFVDTYQDQATAFTCNPNGRAKRIDYLFHTPDLCSVPGALPHIDDRTPLPSADEPSDHLAVMAHIHWTGP